MSNEFLTRDDVEAVLADTDLPDDEREAWQAFNEEIAGYCPDWEYGDSAIRDSAFVEYAQDLAEDIGAVDKSNAWPSYCIDWERAARELQMDYSAVEDPDGVTWWVR